MNIVKFPGLNLEFSIPQVAFKLWNIDIYMYSICIICGIISAFIILALKKDKYEIKYDDVLECSVFAIIFGIIGARIYYCIFNFELYKDNLYKVLNLRDGGIAIYGALIAGTITIYFYSKIKKINLYDFLDYIIPTIAIAQCIGRFGNFFNVEAYGEETRNILRMGINTLEGYKEVHPTFLYESSCTLIIGIGLLLFQRKRKFKGEISLLYLISYSFIRFFIEGLRQDSLMIGVFRVSQLLSIMIFIISLIIFIVKNKSKNKEIC